MKLSWTRSRPKATFVLLLVATVFLAACSNAGSNNEPSPSVESSAPASQPASSAPASAASSEQPAAEPVTIEFWHTYGEGEDKVFMEEVLPAFYAQYPNITVNATRMPTENLKQQVITAIVGGAAPDLMRMDIIWVAEFADQKALVALDDMPNFEEIKAGLFPGPMQTNFYDGKYYGVPLDTNTKVNIYNKAELEALGAAAPPTTIDEFVALARKAKEKNKTLITIGGTDSWNMPPFFWTLGGRFTDDEFKNAEGFFNGPDSVKAMETILAWHKEGLLSPPILAGEPGTWDGLDSGQYVSINDGPWYFGIKGDAVKETMIPAKMPSGPDGKSHSIVGGQDLVMFAGSKQQEAAWVFSRFLLTEDIQKLMAVKAGVMPTNMNAANSEEMKGIYYMPAYVAELETALPRTPSAQWGEIEVLIGEAFEKIMREASPVKEALDEAAARIDALLKQKNL